MTGLCPDPALVKRFAADLGPLLEPEARLGLAVSGGPDSLALLLLTAAVRHGSVEAATVDHALRPESRSEAQAVAEICERLGVPHRTLTAEWKSPPTAGVQERARLERYRLLGQWLSERRLDALLTAHHLDDQAETMVMRLNRGAGVRGLAGMRAIAPIPGGEARLVRPLLGWRRSELEQVCAAVGIQAADDPSNCDDQFERVRVRRALSDNEWLNAVSVAKSAANLAVADDGLDWAADLEWDRSVQCFNGEILYRPTAPAEICRRIVGRAIAALASEGVANPIRGSELDRVLAALQTGGSATLRGVQCRGGPDWKFSPAPRRS